MDDKTPRAETEPSGLSQEEIEVICCNCSFPVESIFDENGKFESFKEHPAPKTMEEAMEAGWLDHGLGLYCPKCSLTYLEDLERDQEAGAETGARSDYEELMNLAAFQEICPDVSIETARVFIAIFRHNRLRKLRAAMNLPPLEPMATPEPKDEAQALEFLKVTEVLAAQKESVS